MKSPKRHCEKHDEPYVMTSTRWRCRSCNRESTRRQRNGTSKKRSGKSRTTQQYYDKYHYGLSHDESIELRSRGRCDACGTQEGTMCIDHDHESGKVRGLLCRHCNLVLGHAKDSPQLLRMLADYLERP